MKSLKARFWLVLLLGALIATACGSAAVDEAATAATDTEVEETVEEETEDESSDGGDAEEADDSGDDAVEAEEEPAEEEVELVQGDSLLDQVTANGVVRIGVRNDNPPVSFIDEAGDWVGFDLDLAMAMGEQLGLEVELVPVDGTTRISFLESGQIDLAVASMNHTRSRDEAIDFSVTYFWDNQSFLVRTGEYENIDELFGQTVAASAGSSTIDSWTSYVAERDGDAPEFVEFEDKNAAVEAVRSGAVEGYTEDNITMLSLANGDPNLTLLPGGHNAVQFGMGVPENQSDWLDTVNFALQDIWTSGEFIELYNPWFVDDTRLIDLPLGGEVEVWG